MERNQVLTNFVSGEDLSGKEYYIIGSDNKLCDTDGEASFGVIKDGSQASGQVCVAVVGGETDAYVVAKAGLNIAKGDFLCPSAGIQLDGAGAGVEGLLMKWLPVFSRSFTISHGIAATSVDELIFTAPFECTVTKISEVHAVAGDDSSAVSATVRRCQDTEDPTAGDDLLGTTKLDLKGTVNTVQSPALTSTAAHLTLDAGDRLSIDYTGTLTTLAGGAITVELESTLSRNFPFAIALENITADGSNNTKKLIRIRII